MLEKNVVKNYVEVNDKGEIQEPKEKNSIDMQIDCLADIILAMLIHEKDNENEGQSDQRPLF